MTTGTRIATGGRKKTGVRIKTGRRINSGARGSAASAEPVHFNSWRYLMIYGLAGLVAGIFILRLFGLQILNKASYLLQAEDNRTEVISIPPSRGSIYDRNGITLARNIASYDVVITPAYLPDDDGDIQNIYRNLSIITGVPVNHGTVEDAKLLAPCVAGPGITQFVDLGRSSRSSATSASRWPWPCANINRTGLAWEWISPLSAITPPAP
jgi:hypothetical protein